MRIRGRAILPWLFLAPMLGIILFAWVIPMVLTVYLSFTDLSSRNFLAFIRDFFTPQVKLTLENFERIFYVKDP